MSHLAWFDCYFAIAVYRDYDLRKLEGVASIFLVKDVVMIRRYN